ncbi:MAG: response regulator transcription factor [Saprospiraceae bacterium]|jgi:DNA-binding NarL/FixJ family response regulator|nr:response regulator transcription factor [Saprospiraceae bacterium]
MDKIKVSIYEDNAGLREILVSIVKSSDEFLLMGDYGHCRNIIQNIQDDPPDVIIMDINMPGKSGIEGVLELKSKFPQVEVIMNTMFDDDDKIFQALKAGATGYLLKKSDMTTILNSIKEVYNGGAPMTPSIARRVLQLPFDKNKEKVPHFDLTERELQILQFMAKGMSYKMVAHEMTLSLDTIRTYIKSIYKKLHVHSVTEAVHKIFIKE